MHVTGWSTALVFSVPVEFTFYTGKQLHASVVIWLQGRLVLGPDFYVTCRK